MIVAVKEKIRIRIKGYDHQLVDQSAEKIVETARRTALLGYWFRRFPAVPLAPGRSLQSGGT